MIKNMIFLNWVSQRSNKLEKKMSNIEKKIIDLVGGLEPDNIPLKTTSLLFFLVLYFHIPNYLSI